MSNLIISTQIKTWFSSNKNFNIDSRRHHYHHLINNDSIIILNSTIFNQYPSTTHTFPSDSFAIKIKKKDEDAEEANQKNCTGSLSNANILLNNKQQQEIHKKKAPFFKQNPNTEEQSKINK